MIKINLLPEPDDSETLRRATFAGAGATFVGVIILGILQLFFAKSEIIDNKKKLNQLKTELAQLKEQTQEVQELEKLKNDLEQTAKAILSVKFKQIGPSRFFQDVIQATPERVWLSGAEENEPGVLTVKGFALNDFSLASFLSCWDISSLSEGVRYLVIPNNSVTSSPISKELPYFLRYESFGNGNTSP